MNLQAMMKQAQKLQNDMMKEKQMIETMTFEGKSNMVTVQINGNKEMTACHIGVEMLEKEDIEMLEDMIIVAYNQAAKEVDKETEKRLGKYTQGMPGLF